MEQRNKKLLKNTLILSIGVFCTKIINFLMVPLYTRWLSQESYGQFDLLITYITLLLPIITLSCGEAVFRFLIDKSDETERKKNIVSTALAIDIVGLTISIIIILISYKAFNLPIDILIYFLILLSVETIYDFNLMICRGLKKINLYTISGVLYILCMTIFTVINLKVFNMDLKGIILGYILGYTVSTIFLIIKGKTYSYINIKSVKKTELKKMLKYSLPLIPNSISWWIVNVSDRTIITVILGTTANAVLAVANKIPNICSTFFHVFHISWQENASETVNDEDVNEYYNSIYNKVIITMASICLVILSLNYFVFNFIFSTNYFEAFYLTPILIFSIFVSMIAQFLGGIYIANKESKKNGFTTMIAALSNLIIHIILINYIGIFAATISTLCSYCILYIIRYIDVRKKYELKISIKSKLLTILFVFFTVLSYINNIYLYIVLFIISSVVFIYINKDYVLKIKNMFLKRKKHTVDIN